MYVVLLVSLRKKYGFRSVYSFTQLMRDHLAARHVPSLLVCVRACVRASLRACRRAGGQVGARVRAHVRT